MKLFMIDGTLYKRTKIPTATCGGCAFKSTYCAGVPCSDPETGQNYTFTKKEFTEVRSGA